MITFENLDELKKFLQRDKGQNSFSPVRFINVDSLNDWFDMKNFLSTLTTNFIFLSGYCTGNDNFPNLRKLRNDLQKETRNICILPLSEFLRVNPDEAEPEIKRFLNLYKGETYSFRIYFLMYRLKSFFLSLKISDPRKKNCVIMSSSEVTDNYSLTIIQKSMRLKTSGERVDGFKQYLKYWEKLPNAALTLYTENAVYLQDKKFFDDVKVIANAFDLLRHHYALSAELKRNFGREEDWQHLAELIAMTGNFERAFCKALAVDGFGTSSLKNFGERENFQKWLLWLRCKLKNSGYVARCAKESSSPEEFVTQIYELIFSCADEKSFDELCNERQEILLLMKVLPPENFLERVRQSDKRLALKILTDNSHAERLLIFETLQKFRLNECDAAQEILQRIFPALAKYLSDVGNEIFTSEQAEYFRRYRWLKVTNHLTEDFNQRVTEIAKNTGKNIYGLEPRNQVVGEEYSDAAAIFFVDGLGAEYLNFLAEDFAPLMENFSVKYRVGRCNLPSVTENNKDFLQGRNVFCEILDLDTLKHTNLNYPENILSELKFLSTLKEKILHALDEYEKIILCADHGTSRLAVLARQTKFDNALPAEGRKIYKSGRFADALADDEKIFPNALEYDGKIIFADYSRFIQKGSTGSEIHGGASLEEILVPVITIERREKFSAQKNFQPAKKIKRGIAKNEDFNI
ncbi:MAG: BREX-4 system phosphatase PglZ [Selenomonadaceae bacterium]|nr:BREX-4 system phosphatase PglZ [Selenomonadaceae bacterium]